MVVSAQLDLPDNDDWDHLLDYEVDATEIELIERVEEKI